MKKVTEKTKEEIKLARLDAQWYKLDSELKVKLYNISAQAYEMCAESNDISAKWFDPNGQVGRKPALGIALSMSELAMHFRRDARMYRRAAAWCRLKAKIETTEDPKEKAELRAQLNKKNFELSCIMLTKRFKYEKFDFETKSI